MINILSDNPMTNIQLDKFARNNIKNFRGVFMRNDLPSKIHLNESGIVNLDSNIGPGTHWVAYVKNNYNVKYFDSFGNLRPPKELIDYFGKYSHITYNYSRQQNFNESICGQLCLKFLLENTI